ncbi:MAG TPA: plastocyanin/azurin family copper-binding protein [Puia sp.]|nr:plastocyanin/azurin family copper-binding protein [Puia sp.]
MRSLYVCVFAVTLIFISCGQSTDDKKNSQDSSATTHSGGNAETTVPGVEKLSFTDTISLKAGESMRFDNELFRVRTGKKIKLIFTNTGKKSPASMTHNVVVLMKGTDIADFADAVHSAKNDQYVPASVAPLVIAHTGMVGGGDSETIEFTIPQSGVYDFICSFPGHWGTMQGKIVAK